MSIRESVEYAIKTNELEGAVYTEDDKKEFEKIATGEMSPEEYLEKVLKEYRK